MYPIKNKINNIHDILLINLNPFICNSIYILSRQTFRRDKKGRS